MAATDGSRLRQNSFERPLTYSEEAEEEVVSVRCAVPLKTRGSQVCYACYLGLSKRTGVKHA